MEKLKYHYQISSFSMENTLYREHFSHNYNSLQYSKLLQLKYSSHKINKIKLPILQKKSKMKTLIFDLDETLVHCNESSLIYFLMC